MKEKILLALKNKYTNLGFGPKAFEGVADFLAATVTDETAIETAVNGVETVLKAFQGDIDKRVTDATAKAKLEAIKSQNQPTPDVTKQPEKAPTPDGQPEWLGGLLDVVKGLTGEVAALKGNKIVGDRTTALSEKLKDTNPTFKAKILKDFARMNFETDESFNEYLTETETDAKAYVQEQANQGLSGGAVPYVATSQASKAVDEDIKAWGAKGVPQPAQVK